MLLNDQFSSMVTNFHPCFKPWFQSEKNLIFYLKILLPSKHLTWIFPGKIYFGFSLRIYNKTREKWAYSLHKKMKFSTVNVTKSCSILWIWSHILKKSLMENFIFCAMILPKIISIFFQEKQILTTNQQFFFGGGSNNNLFSSSLLSLTQEK